MTFHRVGLLADLAPGRCRTLRIGVCRIAVWNADGRLYAIEDACRHMKAPLSTGSLEGTTLTCSWHGWKYDITTGACHARSRGCLRTFPVKVEDGQVLVSDAENPPAAGERGGRPPRSRSRP